MDLKNFTGKSINAGIPQTASEVKAYMMNLIKTKNYTSDLDFIEDLAKLLAKIGEESLDSSKVIGWVSYANGPRNDQWDVIPGKHPFHKKDPITGEMVGDPRVVTIGKFIAMVGNQSGQGNEYMMELYKVTGKYYHNYMSSLGYAWSGIPEW